MAGNIQVPVVLTQSSSATDASSYATASVTLPANHVIYAVFGIGVSAGIAPTPTSVTSSGATWVQVNAGNTGNDVNNLSVWRTMVSSAQTGTITLNVGATVSNCGWQILDVGGVDTSGTNGSGATIQSNAEASAVTGPTATLGSGIGTDNATLCAILYGAGTAQALSAGTGYTALGARQTSTSPTIQVQSEYDLTGTTVASWTTGNTTGKILVVWEVANQVQTTVAGTVSIAAPTVAIGAGVSATTVAGVAAVGSPTVAAGGAAAAVTVAAAGVGDTSAGSSYDSTSFTPVQGDLLVVLAHANGSLLADGAAGAATASANGITFTRAVSNITHGGGGQQYLFVANQLVGASPVAMTVTLDVSGDPAVGGAVSVARVAGMTKVGSAAVRQSAVRDQQLAATSLGVTFASAPLTTNVILAFVENGSDPAGVSPPAGFTEGGDTGYATPNTGHEWAYRNSGHTSTLVSWATDSSQAWSAMIAELDTSAGDVGVLPTTVAVIAAVNTPTKSAGAAHAATTVARAVVIGAATVLAGTQAAITPTTVAAVAAVGAPTVVAGTQAAPAPATVARTVVVGAPTVNAGHGVDTTSVSRTVLIGVPTLFAGGGASPSPATVAVIAAVPIPTQVRAGHTVTAVTVAGNASVGAPTVVAGTQAAVAPTTVTGTTTVSGTAAASGAASVPVSTVSVVATVAAPAPHAAARPVPATVAALATIGAPSVAAGHRTSPSTIARSVVIGAPTLAAGTGATPAPATVAVIGAVAGPVKVAGAAVAPSTITVPATVWTPNVVATSPVDIQPATIASLVQIAAPTIAIGTTVAAVTVVATAEVGAGAGTGEDVFPTTVLIVASVASGGAQAPGGDRDITVTGILRRGYQGYLLQPARRGRLLEA